jgi:hypothetical protein
MARTRASEPLTSQRRRQRSVRVTVAVTLLSVATVGVAAALPTQSPMILSASSVVAIVLAWAAVRITWTEVLQSRREHASDRAATASAYRTLFSERASEHAEFTSVMTERLAESNTSIHELRAALVNARRQAAEVEVRAETAESGFASALVRVAELERSIDVLREEQEKAAAAAELELADSERGSLEDLVDFDEKVARAAGKHSAEDAKLA